MKSPREMLEEFNRQHETDKRAGLAKPETPAPETLDDKGQEHLVALIFTSSSGGTPHIVSVRREPDGSWALTCTCDAMLSIASRPNGCWAMQASRRVIGIPEPTRDLAQNTDLARTTYYTTES